LDDIDSAQFQAIRWLANEDPMNITTTNESVTTLLEIQQRYIAVTLFYATRGFLWETPLNFLSESPVCEWNDDGNGIFCNEQGLVTELEFGT
jgi:hypothetical protein